jgi:hypothetical protein
MTLISIYLKVGPCAEAGGFACINYKLLTQIQNAGKRQAFASAKMQVARAWLLTRLPFELEVLKPLTKQRHWREKRVTHLRPLN